MSTFSAAAGCRGGSTASVAMTRPAVGRSKETVPAPASSPQPVPRGRYEVELDRMFDHAMEETSLEAIAGSLA
jgi:hypothetical protein